MSKIYSGKEKRQRGDNVDAAEHRPFQPVRLAVEGDEASHDHGGPEGAQLQGGEAQAQRMAEQGAEEDEEGGYQQGDLDRGAEGDAHGEVHVVLVGDLDADDVFGDVADYRHEYDPDEELGDAVLLGERFYGPDECLRDVGDGGGCHEQQHERGGPAERGVSLAHRAGPWAAEDVDQVEDVEHEHHHGHLDAQIGRVRSGVGYGEDGRQRERGGHDGEHRGVDTSYLHREALDAVLQASEQDAGPEHEQYVAYDRPDDRSLDHRREARGEGEDGDYELGGVAEGGVEDAADARASVIAEALGGLSEDPRQPNQGQRRDGEEQQRRGVQKLHGRHADREHGRPTVGDPAEHGHPLQTSPPKNIATIL